MSTVEKQILTTVSDPGGFAKVIPMFYRRGFEFQIGDKDYLKIKPK
jgi:hypothetical protein